MGFDFGPPPAKYGQIDGDFGPKTEAAVFAFEASRKPKQPPATGGVVASLIVEIAKAELAKRVRETSKNQGPEIAKYWTATNYPDGFKNREPYCAAFVCWVVKQACAGVANRPFTLPTSPVAYDLEIWARANAKKGVGLPVTPRAGDLFTLATASHCGVVVGVEGAKVQTAEANTDGTGGRDGDGDYFRVRPISSIRRFIRISL